MGHNGGPDMSVAYWFALIGPRPTETVLPFDCGAPWTGHATDEELKRLGTLQGRITRREKALQELRAERKRIMKRCITRMRRSVGKN